MRIWRFGRAPRRAPSADGASTQSVLFVAFHFAPENASGTHRALHFARALEESGHRVWVVAGPADAMQFTDDALSQVFPWPERIVRPSAAHTIGSVYRLFKRLVRAERHGSQAGSQVGSAQGRPRRPGVLQWLKGQVSEFESLPDVHRGWYRRAVRAALRLGRRQRVAAVFVSGPPWTAMRVGHSVASRLGVPLIADFRDPWSIRTGAIRRRPHAWAQRIIETWERAAIEDARVALFNSPVIAAAAKRTAAPWDAERVRVILNGSDVPLRSGEASFPTERPLRIRHFGTLYIGRSVEPLLAALGDLVAGGHLQPREVEIDLFGESAVSRNGLGGPANSPIRMRTFPPIPFTDAASRMAEPALLLMVQPEWASAAIPSKLYDYLATGNPVLVMASERSAAWEVAKGFRRCTLLRPERHPDNATVLLGLIDTWRRGSLVQENAAEDARHLTKTAIGASFVGLMNELLSTHA